jgi:hypothetical protein
MKKILCLMLLLIFVAPSVSFAKNVRVKSSITKAGKYRKTHVRTTSNKTKLDNWSTKGNVNPYTGKKGTQNSL